MDPKHEAYKHAYKNHLKAKRNNDPWSGSMDEPDPSSYGLTGSVGTWLAAHLRKEAEKELEGSVL